MIVEDGEERICDHNVEQTIYGCARRREKLAESLVRWHVACVCESTNDFQADGRRFGEHRGLWSLKSSDAIAYNC